MTELDEMYIPTFDDMQAAHERIKPHIHRTPVLTSSYLDGLTGAELYFKCENFQKAGGVQGARRLERGLRAVGGKGGQRRGDPFLRQPRALAQLCG